MVETSKSETFVYGCDKQKRDNFLWLRQAKAGQLFMVETSKNATIVYGCHKQKRDNVLMHYK